MTCSEVEALLARDGAVTLTTGANTYDRYYAPAPETAHALRVR
jgi:hypothetical protein